MGGFMSLGDRVPDFQPTVWAAARLLGRQGGQVDDPQEPWLRGQQVHSWGSPGLTEQAALASPDDLSSLRQCLLRPSPGSQPHRAALLRGGTGSLSLHGAALCLPRCPFPGHPAVSVPVTVLPVSPVPLPPSESTSPAQATVVPFLCSEIARDYPPAPTWKSFSRPPSSGAPEPDLLTHPCRACLCVLEGRPAFSSP